MTTILVKANKDVHYLEGSEPFCKIELPKDEAFQKEFFEMFDWMGGTSKEDNVKYNSIKINKNMVNNALKSLYNAYKYEKIRAKEASVLNSSLESILAYCQKKKLNDLIMEKML